MSPVALLTGLCDDAAIFPPGDLAIDAAVEAHLDHGEAPWAELVGPFVIDAARLPELAGLTRGLRPGSFGISLVVDRDALPDAAAEVRAAPEVGLMGVEVPPHPSYDGEALVAEVGNALRGAGLWSGERPDVQVFVEVPRDERAVATVDALRDSPFSAKLRTGGVLPEHHPDQVELAGSASRLVAADVRFKATAGLHHAVRNTDPDTGFEQHGFLNLLAATGAARGGAGPDSLVEVLAERDPRRVVDLVHRHAAGARDSFVSFGTCSIVEPVEELVDLGLLELPARSTIPEVAPR